MRSQESFLYKCGGLHLSWVSVGLGGNMLRQVRETTGSIWFDRGEEEDDAAHNFKRSDHVLPIDNMYIEHICIYTYENWVVTQIE